MILENVAGYRPRGTNPAQAKEVNVMSQGRMNPKARKKIPAEAV
jgi:hypothetical protein